MRSVYHAHGWGPTTLSRVFGVPADICERMTRYTRYAPPTRIDYGTNAYLLAANARLDAQTARWRELRDAWQPETLSDVERAAWYAEWAAFRGWPPTTEGERTR